MIEEENLLEKILKKFLLPFLVVLISIFALFQHVFIGHGIELDPPKIISFEKGQSIQSFAKELKTEKVISSPSLLVSMIVLLGNEKKVQAGSYFFHKSDGAFFVAKRLLAGDFGIAPVKITFPEGFNRFQMAERLTEFLPNFNSALFLERTENLEGTLFPETYFFMLDDDPNTVIEKLTDTFEEKIDEHFKEESKEKTWEDTLILASIVEKEVRGEKDKKIVAGIFQNRLKIGMALQADSTLAYVTGRDSYNLTTEDLKSENLYNTYKYKGLPPTPIGNPGIESIEAVLNPTPNDYIYFLTDKSGDVYYAKTFEEHKKNKANYLHAY